MKEEYTENDKVPKLLMCKYSMQSENYLYKKQHQNVVMSFV